MSAADLVTIIGVVTVAMTSLITAVTGAIIAVRTSSIKTTGEQTHQLVNGHNAKLEALVQKQGNEMYDAGLPPTQGDNII